MNRYGHFPCNLEVFQKKREDEKQANTSFYKKAEDDMLISSNFQNKHIPEKFRWSYDLSLY